jgi:hypothetical protein
MYQTEVNITQGLDCLRVTFIEFFLSIPFNERITT